MNFYDRKGYAVAYTDDGEKIYLFDGSPAAYLRGDLVYSYRGYLLGRFGDGWIRDRNGACALFTEGASGGPVKPGRHIAPAKAVKRAAPLRSGPPLRRAAPRDRTVGDRKTAGGPRAERRGRRALRRRSPDRCPLGQPRRRRQHRSLRPRSAHHRHKA